MCGVAWSGARWGGTSMRLPLFGGGAIQAKAMAGWPGVIFNSSAFHGPAPWKGERCAIVYYTGAYVHCLQPREVRELISLGFRPLQ